MNNEQIQKELDRKRDEFVVKRSGLIQKKVDKERLQLTEKNTILATNELISRVSEVSKAIEEAKKSTQKVVGNVSVENLPEVQKVELQNKKIDVSNFPEVQAVKITNQSGSTKVENFPEVQKVKIVERDKSVSIENLPDIQKVKVVNPTEELVVKDLPWAEGDEPSRKANPSKYLPVRLTNGKTFLEGVGSSMMAGGGGGVVPFSKPDGTPARASIDNDGHIQVDIETMPDVTVTTGDIQIGAVEIKNSTDDTRATVGTLGLYVDPQPLTTIYAGTKTAPTVTAEAIASSQAIHSVTVKALSTNTVAVYVGATGCTVAAGFELLAGESISLDVDNLNLVYCISGNASQVVRYIGV